MKTIITTFVLLLTGTALFAQNGHHKHNHMKAERVNADHSLHQFKAEWTSHRGDVVQLDQFSGEPVVIVMFYGNCTEVCPILIQDAWRLYDGVSEENRPHVNVLAITFDPENDTPEVLNQYAIQEQLDISGWHFVTAEPAKIREMAMLLGVQFSRKSNGHFAHSNLVTVLNGEGRIIQRVEGLGRDMKPVSEQIDEQFNLVK